MATMHRAVELLDRALSYTRVALHGVTDHSLHRPTTCGDWLLGDLLLHMDDSLDAIAEGATGTVQLHPRPPTAELMVTGLQIKACALLGAWSAHQPSTVSFGEHDVDTGIVVLAAALEITVHGWDVEQAMGTARPIPPSLAGTLLALVPQLVSPADRPHRFGPARATPPGTGDAERLVAALGRRPLQHPLSTRAG